MKVTRIRLLFSVIFVLLIALSYVTYRNLSGYMSEVQRVRRTNDIINITQEILSSIKDAETGHRGFQLSADSNYLEPYFDARKTIPKQFNILDSLSKPYLLVYRKVDTLGYLINKQFRIIEDILESTHGENRYLTPSELARLDEGKTNMNHIREITTRIVLDQEARMEVSLESEGGFKVLTPISFLVTALMACGGVLFLFTRIILVLDERDKKAKELAGALGNLRTEITSRKYTQEVLRNVLDNSLDGIFVFKSIRDGDGNITGFKNSLVNMAAEKFVYRKAADLADKTLLDIFPGYPPYLYAEYKKVVEAGTPFKTEVLTQTQAGEELWLKITAVKMEDGFILTLCDITLDKLNEIKMEQFTLDLKRSNEDLEQFAYVASHDLQEPLRKIRSFGDRLLTKYESALDETGKDYIDRMQTAASRMQNLIEDLLEFSRVSNKAEEYAEVNVEYLLDEISDDLSDQIRRKNASLLFSRIPTILGIRSQVKRLFQNIISNALKFQKPDTTPIIKITSSVVTAKEVAQEFNAAVEYNTYVRIEVEDNGIGFNEKYTLQIFNIFQRLHGKAEFEGTGIGLAICKRIVTNHKGFIRAESEEGVGSKFIITLPCFNQ